MNASLVFSFFALMDKPGNGANQRNALSIITSMKMPFGKYKGRVLCDLPVEYLEWFARKGFPPGQMGMLLSTVYEIKINGLEYLLTPLRKKS
jgi:hypothetical protein